MMSRETSRRQYVRSFFTSPAVVDDDDSAQILKKAVTLRGMQAPDVWVPDNEDGTAPGRRDEGVENIIEVVSEHGEDLPGKIHPRIVWHRDDPKKRRQGFEHMLQITDPDRGAKDHIDGFVIPEVGMIDDWKKADEFMTIVEAENGLEEGSLAMSPLIESGEAELALSRIGQEIGKSANNLQRLYLLVDGEVDYTKDMRAMTPTGDLPSWPELRHNTSRAASSNDLIAVDGPYDDIQNVNGYKQRMTENQAKGMLGIWSLTPGQVEVANTSPLPPQKGTYLLTVGRADVELEADDDGTYIYDGPDVELQDLDGGNYRLRIGGEEKKLTEDELQEELRDRLQYVTSMDDIVDSMEKFEQAKDAGRGAISIERTISLVFNGIEVEVTQGRMWDEAVYQAVQTPIGLFQEVYEARPDQRDELEEMYGEGIVERALSF